MINMFELPDGAVAVFLDANGNPVEEKDAVSVKVIYPNGRIVFGYSTRKSGANHPRNTGQHKAAGINDE